MLKVPFPVFFAKTLANLKSNNFVKKKKKAVIEIFYMAALKYFEKNHFWGTCFSWNGYWSIQCLIVLE